MLTPRQNFNEVIKGGKPERFVKQYEFIKILSPTPSMVSTMLLMHGVLQSHGRKEHREHSLFIHQIRLLLRIWSTGEITFIFRK